MQAMHGGHSVCPRIEAAERGSTAACVSAMAKLRQQKQSYLMEEYYSNI